MNAGSQIFKGVIDAARSRLLVDFSESNGFQHSGIKGEERSEALADFLSARLPPAFAVATGEVIDSRDRRTGQLDLIIFDQTMAKPILSGRKNEIYPCEALFAVIEVKSILSRAEIEKCLLAAQKVRKLKPFKDKFVDARTKGAAAEKEMHRCMYIVFSYGSNLTEKDWLQAEYSRIEAVAKEKKISSLSIDRVVVLDRGIINPVRSQGKSTDGDPANLFAEFFLHLVNFLERERGRRPVLSWQDYTASQSKGWRKLTTPPDA